MSTFSPGSLDPVRVGTYVRVSSGEVRPTEPGDAMDAWDAWNFDAVIVAYLQNKPGYVKVQQMGELPSFLLRTFCVVPLDCVTPIPGKPLYGINVDAFNPEVVGPLEQEAA